MVSFDQQNITNATIIAISSITLTTCHKIIFQFQLPPITPPPPPQPPPGESQYQQIESFSIINHQTNRTNHPIKLVTEIRTAPFSLSTENVPCDIQNRPWRTAIQNKNTIFSQIPSSYINTEKKKPTLIYQLRQAKLMYWLETVSAHYYAAVRFI